MIIYFVVAVLFLICLRFPQKQLFCLCFGLLFLIGFFRDTSVGADNFVYALNYRVISFDPNTWSAYTEMEAGYCWLMACCKEIFGFSYVDFMRLNAVVYLLGTFFFIKKCSVNVFHSLFFFFFMLYYTESFNIMRQYFALGIFCLGYSLFFYEKFSARNRVIIFELFVIAVAFGFHKSLLILSLLPLFQFNKIKCLFQNNKFVLVVLLASYILIFVPSVIQNLIPSIIGKAAFLGDRYVGYLGNSLHSEQKLSIFTSFMNTAVVCVLVVFLKNSKKDYLPFYLVVLGTVLANIFGSLTTLFLRVSTNFLFFQILLFPYVWQNAKNVKLCRVMLVLYSIVVFTNAITKNFGLIVPYSFYGG